jgi:hypothetical protein
MHFIKEIPHETIRISLFEWNSKYILKFETPHIEQSYKFSVLDFGTQNEIEELAISSSFIEFVSQTFTKMYEAMAKATEY